jgi:hypothetical protein
MCTSFARFMEGYRIRASLTRTPLTYSSTLSRHMARGEHTTHSHTQRKRGMSSSSVADCCAMQTRRKGGDEVKS